MRDIENDIGRDRYDNVILNNNNHRLIVKKECFATKINELGRLISSYSNFDTGRIYKETDKLFIQKEEKVEMDLLDVFELLGEIGSTHEINEFCKKYNIPRKKYDNWWNRIP